VQDQDPGQGEHLLPESFLVETKIQDKESISGGSSVFFLVKTKIQDKESISGGSSVFVASSW
jgi:hypothetical protein